MKKIMFGNSLMLLGIAIMILAGVFGKMKM